VDADLRRPSCHEVLGTNGGPGLTEVLTGQADPIHAVQPTRLPFFLVPSGDKPPNPTELLGSRRMGEILGSLQEQYEYILIDSPPLAPVSDALVLATLVDGVVLVIDQQNTPRKQVREAVSRLERVRVQPLGFLLNRVDPHAAEHMYDLRDYYG
jgi:capsular exopolysaccharide synthesis family protein